MFDIFALTQSKSRVRLDYDSFLVSSASWKSLIMKSARKSSKSRRKRSINRQKNTTVQ